ncbi:unnamed protein product [Leuciscus chuanchicus]
MWLNWLLVVFLSSNHLVYSFQSVNADTDTDIDIDLDPEEEWDSMESFKQSPDVDDYDDEDDSGDSDGFMTQFKVGLPDSKPFKVEIDLSDSKPVQDKDGLTGSKTFQDKDDLLDSRPVQNKYGLSGSKPYQVKDDLSGSKPYQVKDDLSGSKPHQVKDDLSGSKPHQVKDDLSGSKPHQVKDDLSGSKPYQVKDDLSGSKPYQVKDDLSGSKPYQVKDDLSGSKPHQVKDDLSGSKPHQVKDDLSGSKPFIPLTLPASVRIQASMLHKELFTPERDSRPRPVPPLLKSILLAETADVKPKKPVSDPNLEVMCYMDRIHVKVRRSLFADPSAWKNLKLGTCLVDSKKSALTKFYATDDDMTVRLCVGAFLFKRMVSLPQSKKTMFLHCELDFGPETPTPSAKACMYNKHTKMWTELYGDDAVCKCCASQCPASPRASGKSLITSESWELKMGRETSSPEEPMLEFPLDGDDDESSSDSYDY